jgi:hypothetical protein
MLSNYVQQTTTFFLMTVGSASGCISLSLFYVLLFSPESKRRKRKEHALFSG